MSDSIKHMLMALAVATVLGYVVMGVGSNACGKNITESDDELAAFGKAACEALASGDSSAFEELLLRDGDRSVDGKYGWKPYSQSPALGYSDWLADALKAFAKQVASRPKGMSCGDIAGIERGTTVLDKQQGRVNWIRIAVNSEDGAKILELGTSVLTLRARAFQGREDGEFVHFVSPGSTKEAER